MTTPAQPAPTIALSHSVAVRFTVLLGVLLAGLTAVFLVIRSWERAETDQLVALAQRQQTAQLERWLVLSRRSLETLTGELTRHPELPRLLAAGRAAPAPASLGAALDSTDADAVWLTTNDGTTLAALGRPGAPAPYPTPLPAAELRGLLDGARPPRVFTEHQGILVELCGEPILTAPAAAPGSPRLGWILVGRHWDPAHLATLASLTEAEVRLDPAATSPAPTANSERLVIRRTLADWQGRPLRHLLVQRETPELALSLRTDARQTGTFLVFGLLLIAGLGLALHFWVLRPLTSIRRSLAHGDPAPLAPLEHDRTELGVLARLVADSFAQRDALRREIEQHTHTAASLRLNREELRRTIDERARLARDLHDGIIQSLYAAGMSLAGIRTLLLPEQHDAAARLEQTRGALNESIRDMRNFITGLEPETLREQSFAQAITALLDFMQSVRSYRATSAIEDTAASRLSLAQRLHAVQIAREAVSNALRHGEAASVSVALHARGDTIVFEVRDDGRGFVPGATPSATGSGHGLANFKRRARELGADLVLHSEVGRGTTVQLIFTSLT